MFGRQERLAILILVMVTFAVITAHLVLEHTGKRPFAVPYVEDTEDGDLVLVSGTIETLSLTKTGGHLLIEVDNLTIFIPNQIASDQQLFRGANITVIGIVQTYRGKKEISVQSASDILINK